jgi:heme exporter protein A
MSQRPPAEDRGRAPILALDGVRRRFGRRVVLDGISLTVRPGEIHLVVGPNGSGKSTLERLAAGLLRCHAGSVRLGDRDPRLEPEARRAIGFLGHQSGLYDDLSPIENLRFAARLFRVADPDRAIAAALDLVAIGPDRAVPVRRLSRGTVQRVAIARSLLHRPAVLLWDEPLTGLDGPSVDRVVDLLRSTQRDGTAVLLVTHDLDPLWAIDARVHLLHQGGIRLTLDTGVPATEFRRRYREVLGG